MYSKTDEANEMTNWGSGLAGGGTPLPVMMPELAIADAQPGLSIVTDATGRRGYWIRFTANLDVMRCVPEKYELNNSYTKDFFVHESLPNLTPWRDTYLSHYGHRAHPSDVELVVTPAAVGGAPDCKDVPVQDGTSCTGIRAIIRNTRERDASNVNAWLYSNNTFIVDYGSISNFTISAGNSVDVIYNSWNPKSTDKKLTIKVLYSGDEININDNETEREIPDINLYDVKPE